MTLDDTAKRLAELRADFHEGTIERVRQGIEEGRPDDLATRRLLAEFVRRAPLIRKHMPNSCTADLAEFITARFQAFLSGEQPDLMKAFGLTLPRRGRRAQSRTQQRQVIAAAEVLELMDRGKTLDEACDMVAERRHMHPSTARNSYTRHRQAAANLLLYRYLLHPSFASPDEEQQSP